MKYSPSIPQDLAHGHMQSNSDSFLLMGCGLGKTAACITFVDGLLSKGDSKGALIVAPLRVQKLTWPAEILKWDHTSWMKVADLRTEEGQKHFRRGSAQIYTINWESLPLVAKLLASKSSGKVPYDTVIFDESTKAKSNDSIRSNTYRTYCPRVDRQIAMTGTPAPNSLMDLWGQMMMVDNGARLGPSFNAFRDRFFEPTDWKKYKWVPQENAEERIYKRISDVTLTLSSSDWLDLPDVVFNDLDVPLTKTLTSQYLEFKRVLVTKVRERTIDAPNAAALITKLLQFTSGALYDGEKVAQELHSLKMDALEKCVKSIGAPVLVMYGYQHEVERIRQRFPHAEFIADAKTDSQLFSVLDRWNRGKIKMLVGHPRSMAHGLNMQDGGSHIVWLTLTYSQEDYNQAISRLFRRGQKAVVNVHRLMCPGTVDWAVAEALVAKENTQGRLLEALKILEGQRELSTDDGLGTLF